MSAIEAIGIGNIEPVHSGGEVCICCSEKEVVVIVHQTKSEDMEVKARGCVLQKFKKSLFVTTIQENGLPVISP